MSLSEYLRSLTSEAKWGADVEHQKRAIGELGGYGQTAIPLLEEIMAVSTVDEIREECIIAIRAAGNKANSENDQTTVRRAKTPRRKTRRAQGQKARTRSARRSKETK